MRILVLARWFPYPPDNGSKIRILNVVKQLSLRNEVVLVSFFERPDQPTNSALAALGEFCSTVVVLPHPGYRVSKPRAIAGLLSNRPRALVAAGSTAMRAAVLEQVSKQKVDLVVACQLEMGHYAYAAPGVPAMLEELELSMLREAARQPGPLYRRIRATLTWLKVAAYVRRLLPRFAACTVVSSLEREHLRQLAPSYRNVTVIPNAVDSSQYAGEFGASQRNTLVYSGALSYTANYDAVRYFLNDIYPEIVRRVPAFVVRITGHTTGANLASLPCRPGVEYTGHVQDIRPVIAQSWSSIVPLRLGGGTRLKILESMALGTPVISTKKGAEGLQCEDGENILLADDPALFACKVRDLLSSPELRARLAADGRRLVKSKYDWNVVGDQLCWLVETHARPNR